MQGSLRSWCLWIRVQLRHLGLQVIASLLCPHWVDSIIIYLMSCSMKASMTFVRFPIIFLHFLLISKLQILSEGLRFQNINLVQMQILIYSYYNFPQKSTLLLMEFRLLTFNSKLIIHRSKESQIMLCSLENHMILFIYPSISKFFGKHCVVIFTC